MGRVLLVRYKNTSRYDGQSGWFLPDDYLNYEEHPDAAARRILQQQVGIDLPGVALARIESFGNGAWHLVFHYRAELREIPAQSWGENIAQGEWFSLDALPPTSEVAHEGWAIDVLEMLGIKPASSDN